MIVSIVGTSCYAHREPGDPVFRPNRSRNSWSPPGWYAAESRLLYAVQKVLNARGYDLLKKHRYVNKTFVQTSRGCHQGCTFCAEPLMNGLKFRYRPVDEVIHEMENCGSRIISINDADFFGTPERPKEVMRALKGRNILWQAGVTSKLAQDDRMLELAAESGCTMLSIGFESISRETLKSVHKHVNRPETFAALVEKVHSYGIMVFGLFMFGLSVRSTSTRR